MNRRIGNKQWREVISFYKEGKRMGLRTVGSVIKGEFVIEYVGEAIDQAKIPKNDLRCRDRSRWSYVMILEKGICIDAGKKGGLARYINHSCDPNCSVDRWIVRGVPRLAIFARRDIVAGEELSYDYKWERDEEQDPTPCLCVSPLCRGTLEIALKTSRRTPSPRQDILDEEIFQPDGEVEVDEAKENLQSQCQMRAVFSNDTTMEANDNEKEEIKNLQEQNVVELKQDASSGAPITSALLKKLNIYENMSRRNNKKGKTDYTTAREKKSWEAKFKMLQTFKKETRHCHVPKRYPQNTILSLWVQQQRRAYKLFQEGRASSLCTTKRGNWRFQMFQAFKKETGHCLVPKGYPQNTSLSLWVQRQRRAYKLFQEGKASSLCTTRLRKLEDVGFIFDGSKFKSKSVRLAELSIIPDEKFEKQWEAKFQMFQAFKKETGHCHVPKGYQPNTSLSSWVQRQRRAYKLFQKGKASSLCTTKLRKLEDVGFIFDGSKFKSKNIRLAELSIIPDEKYEKKWEATFQMLQAFKKETGHCHVPKGYPQNTSLSLWVQRQRRAYKLFQEGKASSLCTTRLRKLEDVGFIFDGSKFKSKSVRLAELSIIPDEKFEKQWEAKFQMFQAFKKETGHCHVPKGYQPNTSLSSWVQRQRRAYKLFQKGKASSLCTTKLRKLEDVGFIFDGSKFKSKNIRLAELSIIPDGKYEKKWEAKFQMLLAFKKETGHCHVPKGYQPSAILSSWVKKQRQSYKLFQEGKDSPLCIARLRKLEDVGFIFDGSKYRSKTIRLAELSNITDDKRW
eukprot:CAMPEP_0171322080 /NCGR_PEP_ID=MMETSP0816-20121228/114735_1 /TAXON_ID=420281 /ORGANISM="Proboscia inermis, Strain CCAP1064/1" /LENGTH=789 /DNA_ID=CAMNT_0011820467 /DNA_START=263 /DNA_END=2630 /DNA_ORIENTATION=-